MLTLYPFLSNTMPHHSKGKLCSVCRHCIHFFRPSRHTIDSISKRWFLYHMPFVTQVGKDVATSILGDSGTHKITQVRAYKSNYKNNNSFLISWCFQGQHFFWKYLNIQCLKIVYLRLFMNITRIFNKRVGFCSNMQYCVKLLLALPTLYSVSLTIKLNLRKLVQAQTPLKCLAFINFTSSFFYRIRVLPLFQFQIVVSVLKHARVDGL